MSLTGEMTAEEPGASDATEAATMKRRNEAGTTLTEADSNG